LPAAPVREPELPAAPLPAGPPKVQFAVVERRGAQIRTGPGASNPPSGRPLRAGDLFVSSVPGDGEWYQGSARNGTVEGWVRASLLAPQPYGSQAANRGRYDEEREADAGASPPRAIAVTVRKGHTLSKIAHRLGVPYNKQSMNAVAKYNRHLIKPDQLNINDRVYIPIELILAGTKRQHRS
jgi:hypothetical protein